MRVERPHDRRYARLAGATAMAGGVALGALAFGATGAALGGASGAALGVAVHRVLERRTRRRRAAVVRPFPEEWRELLAERYDHYDRLPPPLKDRFEADLRILLAEKRITGVGVEVTDELRLLAAASAVTVSLGWPAYEWNQLTDVLLYPDDFDRDYTFGEDELAGQAHPWGTVILSVPSLLESFDVPDDAFHVGIHEFTHLLDVNQTHFDGIPVGLDEARAREWVSVMEKEMERLRRGKSALDEYGANDPVEFLAVAVEAFFEIPQIMRRRHREAYAILSTYLNQDPAAWDDERGLDE